MQIWCNFPCFGQSGWEVVCRSLLIALDKLGVRVQLISKDLWNPEQCFMPEEDYHRLMRMLDVQVSPEIQITHQYPSFEYTNSSFFSQAKNSFCLSIFETNKCPVPWVPLLNRVKSTLTFSEFNRKTYSESGVNNVDIMPLGVDTKMFNPSVKPFREKKSNEFVFLTSGDFTERKNFEGLVEAYVKEFNSKDNVVLIVKAHYQGFVKKYKNECVKKLKEIVNRFNAVDSPRILFLGDKVPWQSVPKFYTAGDCFVLVSRGEGIGLPYAESLASGVPVISATFGGHMQFLNNNNALFVNTSIKVIDDMEYIRKCLWALNHSWAQPELGDVRNKLRFAYEFRDIMKAKGEKGRADMEKLTWQKVALDIVKRCLK